MPLFDEDDEAISGLPEAAVKLKALMNDHHDFLIASPNIIVPLAPFGRIASTGHRAKLTRTSLIFSVLKEKLRRS